MTTRLHTGLLAILLLGFTSFAVGGGVAPQRKAARHPRAGEHGLHARAEHRCENCRIEMRTVQRLVYEPVEETKQTTVYDMIWEQQTIQDVKRVPVTQAREVPYTYHRKITEVQMREVPYTTYHRVTETQVREVPHLTYVPVTETRVCSVPHTVYQKVEEQQTRTIYHSVPRTIHSTRTIQVRGGRWETCVVDVPGEPSQKGATQPTKVCKRVWVPCVEEREVTECRTVFDQKAEVVPFTVTRTIPTTVTREVPRTYTRMVPVRQTRIVPYQVVRTIPEQHVRTVPYTVCRSVPETGTRTVTFVTYEEVPTSRVIDVPRQVPRTVCYKVTRMVPRTECIQVPVRVCDPPGKAGGNMQKGGDGKSYDVQEPYEVEAGTVQPVQERVAELPQERDAVRLATHLVEG